MTQARYKVLPAPTGILGSQVFGLFAQAADVGGAATRYQEILDREGAAGWDLVCFDATTLHNACCFCFSKTETEMKLLVFEQLRDVLTEQATTGAAAASALEEQAAARAHVERTRAASPEAQQNSDWSKLGPALAGLALIAAIGFALQSADKGASEPDAASGDAPYEPPPSAALPAPPAEPRAEGPKPAASPVADSAAPCTLATDPARGDLLPRARELLEKSAAKPTDVTAVRQAAALAEQAVAIDDKCSEAWSALASARYRLAYDICGRGDYSGAKEAAQTALRLATTTELKASLHRTLGRIAGIRFTEPCSGDVRRDARSVV